MTRVILNTTVALVLLLTMSAMGANYVVTTNLDNPNPGTLRWAINAANATLGPDIISFSILPPGPYTINVIGQLPALTDMSGVLIDGLTQPGGATQGLNPPATLQLLITLNGAQAGPASGLWIKSNSNRIQGLVIEEFMQDGISIEGGPEANINQIYWNIIGLDRFGTTFRSNGTNMAQLWGGVRIFNNPFVSPGIASGNQIVENLISGNYAEGVAIWGAALPGDVSGNVVDHNFIGTDITGMLDRGNKHEGVCLTEGTHDNIVSRNLISGNEWDGVGIQGFNNFGFGAPIQTHSNNVAGNAIGLDVTGSPLPNSMVGVSVGAYGQQHFGCADRNTFGPGNVIARNGGHGVVVWEDAINSTNGDRNRITQNSHYDNVGLGIDLQDNGVTTNDVGDVDSKANQELNFPVIDSAVYSGGNTTIYGKLSIDSDPTQATVEIFKVALDPSGYGEGRTYLVSTSPPTATGNWSATVVTLVTGDTVTATGTDLKKNTSEFSANVVVKQAAPPPWNCTTNPPPGKTGGGNELEPNDVCQMALPAQCEGAYCGMIGGPNDFDWWAVTLPADTCYCLHVRVFANATPGQYAFGGGLDPTLSIYASDCVTQLFFNDNHNGVFPEAVGTDAQYDCLDQGNCYKKGTTLYIKVAGSPQSTGIGPYLLVINCERCTCPQAQYDTCTYYKKGYADFCPNGMPDFDQKQNSWWTGMPPGVQWTHCGPVALANCMWWFDSKFESSPVDPRPFYPGLITPPKNDHYRLVKSYDGQGVWDDHDTNNVRPLVDSLALYAKTNQGSPGTSVTDLANAATNWIAKAGMSSDYTVKLMPVTPAFGLDSIRAQVLASQDVILLLGFYQETAPQYCERIGGHYVTIAGTCTDPATPSLCISDPFFDDNEGATVHPSTDHNDASLVSGTHGTNHHDRYDVTVSPCSPPMPPGMHFPLELVNYPINPGNVMNFFGQNGYQPWQPVPPTGAPLHALIEWAIIICPVDTCLGQLPGDVDVNGQIQMADIVALTNILDFGAPLPVPASNADPNGDCVVNYQDVKYLTDYFAGGPAPVKCTCLKPKKTCCVGLTGNVDMDPANGVDISDLTTLVDFLYISFTPLVCPEEANCDGDPLGGIDISDLVWLVDYLYVSFTPVAHCR